MEGDKGSAGAANRRKNKDGRQKGQEYDFFVRRDLDAEEEQEPEEHSAEGKEEGREK